MIPRSERTPGGPASQGRYLAQLMLFFAVGGALLLPGYIEVYPEKFVKIGNEFWGSIVKSIAYGLDDDVYRAGQSLADLDAAYLNRFRQAGDQIPSLDGECLHPFRRRQHEGCG